MKKCSTCNNNYPLADYVVNKVKNKTSNECRICRNKKQREKRVLNNNYHTSKYEKTHKGFLMRLYRNMQSRITGIQKEKYHLYVGKELLDRQEFYNWSITNDVFLNLFSAWESNFYNRKLTPSVDRIDSSKGYFIENMEWVTHSENSRRGSLNQDHSKSKNAIKIYKYDLNKNLISIYGTLVQAAKDNEISNGWLRLIIERGGGASKGFLWYNKKIE